MCPRFRWLSGRFLPIRTKKVGQSISKIRIVRLQFKKRGLGQSAESKISDYPPIRLACHTVSGMPTTISGENREQPATHHHLHADRRSTAVGHQCLFAHRPHVHRARRRQRGVQRHLGGGTHSGHVPRMPDGRTARARCAGRTGQADTAARSQHHQIAQHQRLGGPAGQRH